MSQNEIQISNYKFIETIGEGAFGKVKLAIHIPTGEKVAIKILEKSLINGKEELKRIEKEIKYLKKFNHPNIIQIYEVVENKTSFCIIMEYASGGELFNYIVKKEHIKEKEASFFYYQIIQGIIEIHKKHICHRDIKPENLLLTNDKLLKIIDFNLSNEYNDYLSTPCGSPCYAAPEMIKREKYLGICVDIWASGVILFAMLCGYLPFNDKNYKTLYRDIIKCKIDYPKEDEYIIPKYALDLINKILVVNPQKRITIDKILLHPFIEYGKKQYDNLIAKKKIISDSQKKLIIEYMVKELCFNNENNLINKYLENNRHNNCTTTFKLLEKKMIEDRFCYMNIQKSKNLSMYHTADRQVSEKNTNKKKIQNIIITDFINFHSDKIQPKIDKPNSTYQDFFQTAKNSKTNYQKISIKKNTCLSHRENNNNQIINFENNNINSKLQPLNNIKNLYDHLLSKKFLIKSIVKKIETSVSQEKESDKDKDKTSSTDSRKKPKKSNRNVINNVQLNNDIIHCNNEKNKKNYNSYKKIRFKCPTINGNKNTKNKKSYKSINNNINEIVNNENEENLTKKNNIMINLLKKNKKNYPNSPSNCLISNNSKRKIIYNSKKNNHYIKLPNKLKLDKTKEREKLISQYMKTMSREEKIKTRNNNRCLCSYPTNNKILNKNSLNLGFKNTNIFSKKMSKVANKKKSNMTINKINENVDMSENFNFSNNIINTYNTFDINNNINMNFDIINYSKKSREYNDALDYINKIKYNKKISLNKSRIPKKYEFLGYTDFYKKSQRINVKKKYNFMTLNSLNKNKEAYMSYSEHTAKKRMNDIILNMINQHNNSYIFNNNSNCSDYFNFVNSTNQLESTQTKNHSSKKFISSISNTYTKKNYNQGRNSSRRTLKQKLAKLPPSLTSDFTLSKSKKFIRQKLKNLMFTNQKNININNNNPNNSFSKSSNNNTDVSSENNFLLLSVNMNINLIINKIGNYCKLNGLLIKKNGIYNYQIKNKNNDALIVDVIKASPNNILKLFHLKGDESKTKEYISGLFNEIL